MRKSTVISVAALGLVLAAVTAMAGPGKIVPWPAYFPACILNSGSLNNTGWTNAQCNLECDKFCTGTGWSQCYDDCLKSNPP